MKIEVFILAWNEEKLLPYAISHYQRFADRITVFDNYSDDKTPEIAKANGCRVIPFGIKGVLDDEQYLKVKNHCWKDSDADYVIVVDCDEILYFPEIRERLTEAKMKGDNFFRTIGWDIYSVQDPKLIRNITDIRTGVFSQGYSKPVIFSPRAVYEINYRPGAHVCDAVFRHTKQVSDVEFFLLHYRNWRTFDELVDRHRKYSKRMSHKNRIKGWGIHYLFGESKKRKEYDEGFANSMDLWESRHFTNIFGDQIFK